MTLWIKLAGPVTAVLLASPAIARADGSAVNYVMRLTEGGNGQGRTGACVLTELPDGRKAIVTAYHNVKDGRLADYKVNASLQVGSPDEMELVTLVDLDSWLVYPDYDLAAFKVRGPAVPMLVAKKFQFVLLKDQAEEIRSLVLAIGIGGGIGGGVFADRQFESELVAYRGTVRLFESPINARRKAVDAAGLENLALIWLDTKYLRPGFSGGALTNAAFLQEFQRALATFPTQRFIPELLAAAMRARPSLSGIIIGGKSASADHGHAAFAVPVEPIRIILTELFAATSGAGDRIGRPTRLRGQPADWPPETLYALLGAIHYNGRTYSGLEKTPLDLRRVEAFTKPEPKKPFTQALFTHCVLAHTDSTAPLVVRNLMAKAAYFENVNFENVTLAGGDLSLLIFSNCTFKNVTFDPTIAYGVEFRNCYLDAATGFTPRWRPDENVKFDSATVEKSGDLPAHLRQ